MQAQPELTADVIVLGAGPTGLATALELNRLGVSTVVVERRARRDTVYPTANHITSRSMEIARMWGIADKIRFAGFPPHHRDRRFFFPLLGAEPFYVVDMPPNDSAPPPHERCTETGVWCPRPFLDPVLIDAIEAAPHVTLLDGHEITGLSQDHEAVTVTTTTDGAAARTLVAPWCVNAEGASSATRGRLGIDMTGLRMSTPTVDSLLFDAPDLAERLPGEGTQFWFLAPHEATIVAIDGHHRFRAHVPNHQLTDQDIEAFLTDVVGPVQPVARFPWSPGLALADTYRSNRVFLAGDAAHIVTPYGGLGMNTGIEDAVNIAWRLAAVQHGWATPDLLDDYEPERRPVAAELLRYQGLHLHDDGSFSLDDPLPLALPELPANLEAADAATRAEAGRILEGQRHLEFVKPGLELGIRYPVDGEPAPVRGPREWGRYDAVVTAGMRAPHAVGTDGKAMIDQLGPWLLVIGDPEAIDAPASVLRRRGVPVHTMATTDDVYRDWTIVRPDGFVVETSLDAGDAEHLATITRLHLTDRSP